LIKISGKRANGDLSANTMGKENTTFKVQDYSTAELGTKNGKKLWLFRIPKGIFRNQPEFSRLTSRGKPPTRPLPLCALVGPAGVDASSLDGMSMKVPAKGSAQQQLGAFTAKSGERYVFEAADVAEGSSIRAIATEDQGDSLLSVMPAFSRMISVRRAVATAAPSSGLDASSLSSLSSLPGVTLAYTVRSQPATLRVRCTPPGTTRPGKEATAAVPPHSKKRKEKAAEKAPKSSKKSRK